MLISAADGDDADDDEGGVVGTQCKWHHFEVDW